MKKMRIAMVVLSLLYTLNMILFFGISQLVRGGKAANAWIGILGLLMAVLFIANIVIVYKYASQTGRSTAIWSIGVLFLPYVAPILLAFLPEGASSVIISDTADLNPQIGTAGSTSPPLISPDREPFASIPTPESVFIHQEGLIKKSRWPLDELRMVSVIVPDKLKWWVIGSSEENQYLYPDLMPPEKAMGLYKLLEEWSSAENRNALSGINICLSNYKDSGIVFPLKKLKKGIPFFLAGLYHFREKRVELLNQWLNNNPEVTLRGNFGSKATLNNDGFHLKKRSVTWGDVRTVKTETLNGMVTHLFVLPEGRSGGMFDLKKGKYCLKNIPTGKKEFFVAECFFWITYNTLKQK